MGLKHAIFFILLIRDAAAAGHSCLSRQGRRPRPDALLLEKAALLAFKSAITSDPLGALANWLESNDVCSFAGVECNRWRRHVVVLQLNRTAVAGTISPALANLTCLRQLDLSENRLAGPISPELSSLRCLEELELSGNLLSGSIPGSLSLLSGLTYLNLGGNQLTGSIPLSVISNCTSLGLLDLSHNQLAGTIPSEIGNNWPCLRYLILFENHFAGEIPISLSNSSRLLLLDVENNRLSGELPSGLVSELTLLRVLNLSYNKLRSHGGNTDLRPFFLALANCSNLTELVLVGNGLGGRLPSVIGMLSKTLTVVKLEENKIRGPVPAGIADIGNLTLLSLSSNLLEGTIPEELGRLPRLERLILSNNQLKGTIPPSLGNISSLGLLDLSDNRLSDEIPPNLGNLTRLMELHLPRNMLSGTIPYSLGRFKELNKLDLSYNRLTGEIPKEVAEVSRIFLNLSSNQLRGHLPVELSKMEQVEEIDLSSNNLTGELIPQLSSCIALKVINLSHNALQGPLPGTLGELLNLELLDVSSNSLSGEIPLSLYKCTSLTQINLSFNDFSGWRPAGGVFSSFSDLSFLMNPRLCGSPDGPACAAGNRRLHSRRFLLDVCLAASALAFVSTVACVILIRRVKRMVSTFRSKTTEQDSEPAALKSSYPRITYRELIEATGNFDQGNLVGSGSFGHVYRGVLCDGTGIAVKVLNIQSGNPAKSFDRECQVLKTIRHRNLMRVITACSLPNFKALVLPFMSNGSLERHLYPSSGLPSRLDLHQRVSICSDVAEGMAYLHHHSPVRVIHCDLKPNNVLLDDHMTAVVSDFGISRLAANAGGGNAAATADNVGISTMNLLCGSVGYIAPEYGFGASPSTRGDVYSFGVLVLEMATGKRPVDELFEGGMSLHRWVRSSYPRRAETVVDPAIRRAIDDQAEDEARKMWEVAVEELLELGILCTLESPSLRPTMLDAADELDRLKRYLMGDSTVTYISYLGISSSTLGED